MKYSLGICSILTLFLVACATQPSKNSQTDATLAEIKNTYPEVATSEPESTQTSEQKKSSIDTTFNRYPTDSDDLQVKLKNSANGQDVVATENIESKAKREEISQAISATEDDIKKIVSKDSSVEKTKSVKTETPKEKSAEQEITAVSNEIDSAITEMSEKVEASVKVDKTEEARLRAEAALKGLNPKAETSKFGNRKVGSVPAEKALGWLKNGNKRFITGKLRSDGQSAKDRLRTAHEQAPHAAIITCSDSRMIPELIFDQKLGEIYSVRVVDLSVALNVQASLDFAINSLGTNLVVLLGSESCGNEQKLEFLYNQLLEKSAILQQAVMNGQIRVVRGFYNLSSGQVDFK